MSWLLLSVCGRWAGQDSCGVFSVRVVDEETRAAREVEWVGAAGVVGVDDGRNSCRREHRLGELCVASCGVRADLDHWRDRRVREGPSRPSDALVDSLVCRTSVFDGCHALTKRPVLAVSP